MEIGKERIFLETVDSTNSYALSLAEKGYPHGTVVIADMQTMGRGRLGRKWHSPPGKNIYMSIILRYPVKMGLSLLTIMAAVAVSEAIEKRTSLPVRVKWPNDIMACDDRGYKKVGGILSEARFSGSGLEFVVVGIGINVNSLKEDIPPAIIDSATSLRIASNRDIDRDKLIEGLLGSFKRWYSLLIQGEMEEILNKWRDISLTIGKEVTVITGERVVKGTAIDIDEEGRLLIRLPSGLHKRIDSGDVVHLR